MHETETSHAIVELKEESFIVQEIDHFTIDIETLGLNPNAIVLSIGCVKWNMKNGITGEFHQALDIETQQLGRSITGSTIQFWIDQPRNFGLDGETRHHPYDSLGDLREFILPSWTPKQSTIWAQGPQFDITILEDLAYQNNMQVPWEYNSVRDARTLWKLFPHEADHPNPHKHNALEDARTEALNTINILRALQSELGDKTCVFV